MRISDWSSDVCSSDLPAGAKARHSKTKGPLMRTALITGATAGIGEAAARAFVDAGWRVIGTGRRRARLDALAGELDDAFHSAAFDIRDEAARAAALDALAESFRPVGLLINNTGLALGTVPAPEARLERKSTSLNSRH